MGYLQSGFRAHLTKIGHPAIRKQRAAMRAFNKKLKADAIAEGSAKAKVKKLRKKGTKVTSKQKNARRKNIAIARKGRKKK